jgi:hypothetical protein
VLYFSFPVSWPSLKHVQVAFTRADEFPSLRDLVLQIRVQKCGELLPLALVGQAPVSRDKCMY